MTRLRSLDIPTAPRHGAGQSLPLKVGTRGSPLALWQTRHFLSIVSGFCPVLRNAKAFEEHVISTEGDRVQDRRLADIGGKGLFAKEIHEALLDGQVDFAVHSLKDLETELPPGIVLACLLQREDPRDAIILGPVCGAPDQRDPLACIPHGALIGTASVRRQSQILALRPDLRCAIIRGNVQTRLGRVRNGDFAASFLALAGLKRMGLEREAGVVLEADAVVPAAGQGIVGVTVRARDVELHELLAAIEDREARIVATAERALLGALDGSCRTPIGAYAQLGADGVVRLTGLIARPDGSYLLRDRIEGPAMEAERLGRTLGERLRREAPADILA
ncbi:hydroxymethylbilane synthase [Belnapia sp. F-4-1]|uniref:hydroxymethylbilane synthase n=1 Tax=Belnapia sp. F-4-1 TaxID=1545443 RepID=UPI0006893475|nr:hydroxymethylbilane synthase [Belnapia sp. F-4-1]